MRYHDLAARVAPRPQYDGAFKEAVRRAAFAAMHSPIATEHDNQMCRDMRRDDARYQFRGIDRLLDLLAALPDDAPALAFIEEIRGPLMARRQRNAVRSLRVDAMAETEVQAEADVAVMRVLAAPCPDLALVQKAIEATTKHRTGLEHLLDDLFGERFALAHGGR